ncbi:MAG TPA: efflux RND transporter periplasmic adaptor subunit [Thermodesulfobacteriota bacterium]|jgi:Cu(I)/Ag(I) efflux system membrane fusion protein|nr:efflux RND transporter periplasmic adaptor subunit [Thermodesulfobacteriota bacterium]
MKRLTGLILLLVLPWFIFGCGKSKDTATHKEGTKHEAKAATAEATKKPGATEMEEMKGMTMESIQKQGKVQEVAPGTVQITPERQQLIGVKFGTVEVKSLEKIIRTVGRVDYDEKRIVTVSTKIGGWIEDLYVDFTGRFVKQGDPLLTIYSPELVSTQEEYLIALRAKKSLSKSPFPEVAGSGESLAESAKRRLKLWDISDDQIKALEETGQSKKTLTLFSPFSGFVLEKSAYKGMNVMPGLALYKLVDLSVVWLYADIYEYELPFIRLGQQASIQLSYIPGETFTGKAIYIYPSLNPETRTAKVRFEIPNSHERLKPEMYANVEIKVHLGQKLAVPEGAIIDTGLRQLAIVDKGSGYFEPREVKVGAKVEGYYEVIKGLKTGERVVTSANFLIDSESKLKEAVGGMAGMPGM